MLDTNIIISGITSPRYCFEILNHATQEDFKLILPEIIILEATRNINKKFPQYLDNLKEFILNCPMELIEHPSKGEVIKNKGIIRDESDIPIILSAISAGVDFFVSGDKDFTEITNKSLKNRLNVLSPADFLREIMHWSDEDLERIRLRRWEDLKN